MFIYKAGVIGAGQMGAQIAQVISFSGLPVVLLDQTEEAVQKGLNSIKRIYASRVEKGKMTETEAAQKMKLVSISTDFSVLSDADIVVEAIYEVLSAKVDLFKKLDGILPETAIMASNTSALSLSAMGAATKRPERVIGMHFFNPAHVMKLVEVIPSLATSSEVVDDVTAFAESLRKIPARVNECAGFLVNRLLMTYLNEAAIVLQENTASAKEIDKAMVELGMPMGPFTLLDMIGLDIAEKVAKILEDSFGSRMKPAKLLEDMVTQNRLGQKTGKGFFSYTGEDHDTPGLQKDSGNPDINRILLPMINEAVICYQEGVSSLTDIETAMIAGIGFPQEIGGPFHYADEIGLDILLELAQEYKKKYGERFHPAPMIKRMVAAGFLGKKTKRGFFRY